LTTESTKHMEINKEQYLKKFKIEKKETFEFQEVGIEWQPFFKESIWFLFHIYPLEKLKLAFKACKKQEVYTIAYMRGIIKNL